MASKTLKHIAERILKNHRALGDLYEKYSPKATLPLYCSVDLRDSGFKIVPVDSNLYPAGFNNVCPEDRRTAPPIFKEQFVKFASKLGIKQLKKILILPESHTQNSYYIENLYYLNQILEDAGYEVKIGWYGSLPHTSEDPIHLTSTTEKRLIAYPIRIESGTLSAGGFIPDLILLNNDFSGGYPKPLDQVKQPIVPSHTLGWHSRKKSEHFRHYNQLAGEFASVLEIDPWMVQINTEEVSPVNFNEDRGIDQVADAVDRVLTKTRLAYEAHHIDRKPFVFIKNNAGTYGMGIMVVHSAEELRHLNRRMKNKMSVGKNHLPIDSVIVQEGIPTATWVNSLAAEPVIYLAGCDLIGGFLRSNTDKGEEENLNSQGMLFKKLCMSDLRESESELQEGIETAKKLPTLELVYGSIAKLSTLATGLELSEHKL